MSKLLQKLPRHESNSGQICSGCEHAVSNHFVLVDMEKPKQIPKLHSCIKCNSKVCSW